MSIQTALLALVLMLACHRPEGSGSPLPAPSPAPSSGLEVLFIGNSLTSSNDMPGLFQSLCQAGGKSASVDSITPGGMTLRRHATNPETFEKIRSRKWDVVILQSDDIVAFPDLYAQEVAAVGKLREAIRANRPGTRIVYEMVFGLRDGVTLQELDGSLVTYTYRDYMQKIRTGTLHVASTLDLVVAPVGWSWQATLDVMPSALLFDSDGTHPALRGSYLGACVFYTTLFREGTVGLEARAGLPAAEAALFQRIATSTVLAERTTWNLGERAY